MTLYDRKVASVPIDAIYKSKLLQMEFSVNQNFMNKWWSLIFRYDSHCLKMHVCQSTVMISYYLGKLLWFPPLFNFFHNYLSASSSRLLSSSSSVDLPKSQLTSGMVSFFWIALQDSPASQRLFLRLLPQSIHQAAVWCPRAVPLAGMA